MIQDIFKKVTSGDKEAVKTLPVESLLPILLLKNLESLSTQFELSPEHIEYGFDPDLFVHNEVPKRKAAMLKEIESEWIDQDEEKDPQAIQLIIDENLFNKYLLEFVLIDQSFSLTKFIEMDPRTAEMAKGMNLETYFKPIMPEMVKKYGGAKKFDIMLSLSHQLIKTKLDGNRITGFN